MTDPFTAAWPEADLTFPDPGSSSVTREALHDARQALVTIRALLAAGSTTVADPGRTLTRLQQIESEVLTLGGLLEAAGPVRDDAVVDVGIEVSDLVSVLSLEYPGCIGVAADTDARIRMGRSDLHRILRNLLRNAMRAAGHDGNVHVTVTAGAGDVTILVEDDGPGLGALPVQHGVGLRSVRRLVSDAEGHVDIVAHGRLGGASVRVRVPTAGLSS